jgi:predicted AAA+ superfamily ATPase
MEALYKYSQIQITNTSNDFIRYLYHKIDWTDRLIGIIGARGVGKTTMMLQYIKNNLDFSEKAIYISLDDFFFTKNRLFDFAEDFYVNGGRYLFIDEVHKYADWSRDIKSLYDIYKDLHIVFSGSSALLLSQGEGDLSRRSAVYDLHEMSFREYLKLREILDFPAITLDELVVNHQKISAEVKEKLSIIPLFHDYLDSGVYPFSIDVSGKFHQRLVNTVNVIVESDLPSIDNITYHTSVKLRKLLSLIAESVPFKINISELSRKTELSRDMLLMLLKALERTKLLKALHQSGAPTGHLTKPDKLYIHNTSLLKALAMIDNPSVGTLRETFFMNQLILNHHLEIPKNGDFLVDRKYIFEIGGKNKTSSQIKNIKDAYIAADQIEIGYRNTIPLWLFGFLY